jgi:ribosomal protein S19E (S16A)
MKSKPGSGSRFAAMVRKLSHRSGVSNPKALAAYIGRKKYGKKKMSKWAAKGRKNA